MAKYSTGSDSSGGSESCELCGAENVSLQTTTVAGATLEVCSNCAQHGEDDQGDNEVRDRKRQAAQNTARMYDAASGDSSHWEEEGADYDEDPLPYLVSDYGERVTAARQEAGLQTADLAAAVDAEEADILAVEQGRATKAGVGGSLVAALESELGIEITDSR
jgi:ribosome-binding protein aMBF1 (putative translation factor)